MVKAGFESISVLSHSFHHTSQLPLTEKWMMSQRANETPVSQSHSQQKQYLIQLFSPQLP